MARARWFAAHLVMYVKLRHEKQDRYTAWENVVLIKAGDEREAFEKAERRGREDAEEDESFRWGGRPARWVFAGVRKLTSCESAGRPDDGAEITFTEIQLDSEQSVLKYARGEPVTLTAADRFADKPEGVPA